jgi:ribose-phosphate pyrophosphokinase
MVILSGTSNVPLSYAIAKKLHLTLGDVEITRFIDNECRVFVKENVLGEDVFVIESLSAVADQHLVELCLLGQAARDLGAKTVTAVIPWLGYSKQDKAFRKGEAISAQLVAKFIEAAGFDRVITCELHSETVIPYFHIPVRELSTHQLLATALSTKSKPGFENVVVVSPDSGGKSRSERFAKSVNLPMLYLDKSRDVATGEVTVTGLSGTLKDSDVVIFDDIINSGQTAVKTSQFLKHNGAKRIFFLATHAVLAGNSIELLTSSAIDQIIVTDTIYHENLSDFPKVSVVSTAQLFSDAIVGKTG